MSSIIAKEEINTGRQVEMDYGKALFLVAIFFIHAFQVCGAGSGDNSMIYQVIYSVATMSGAVIYIFGMGIGSTYSKKDERDMMKGGVRLIGYQFLNNIGYSGTLLLGLLLAMPFRNADIKSGIGLASFYLIYLNIFFLAGVLYFVYALLRKLNLPLKGYLILGVAAGIISPLISQYKTGIVWLDLLISPIVGGQAFVSFPIFPYISYALLGVYFGKLLRRVEDKRRFYKILMPVSAVVLLLFTGYVILLFDNWAAAYQYITHGYTFPGSFRVFTNIAGVCFIFGGFYFLEPKIKQYKKLNMKMLFVSKHVSKYYAIHFCLYFFFFGLVGMRGQPFIICCILCVVCMLATDWIVKYYVHRKAAVCIRETEH